jgi:hypothetical protein
MSETVKISINLTKFESATNPDTCQVEENSLKLNFIKR